MALLKLKSLPILSLLLLTLSFTSTQAARFDVTNKCSYTVWAAAVPRVGGKQLNSGETWSFDIAAGTTQIRIWARTKCSFDGSGRGKCETGGCGDVLQCQAFGSPPNTLAEIALNQFNNLDFYDISLVDGFNVPMEFSPTCSATEYSKYFKNKCPDAYSYPKDDATSTFTCPGGANYRVVFCP
ncbi:protein P21-like [Senna tora]|uniref:Protein P21-like n=1 Tax=Senna tora TaxID=362788 RepID=A0A834WP79_9FABA|nr:protein P21-like [Senna tora]